MKQENSQPTKTDQKAYSNNPFILTLDGIKHVFKHAKSVAITLLIISVTFALLGRTDSSDDTSNMMGASAADNIDSSMIGVILLVVLVVAVGITLASILLAGIADYTAAATSRNEKVTLSKAVDAVFDHFFKYLWLRIVVFVKTVLWAVLFIIPGIYFSYRYRLAGVVFFAENRSAMASIDRSLKLTKGAWLTTFTSYTIFNIPTFWLAQLLADTGTSNQLYARYSRVVESGAKHPKPHALSIIFPIVVVGVMIMAILSLALIISANPEIFSPADSEFSLPTQSL